MYNDQGSQVTPWYFACKINKNIQEKKEKSEISLQNDKKYLSFSSFSLYILHIYAKYQHILYFLYPSQFPSLKLHNNAAKQDRSLESSTLYLWKRWFLNSL